MVLLWIVRWILNPYISTMDRNCLISNLAVHFNAANILILNTSSCNFIKSMCCLHTEYSILKSPEFLAPFHTLCKQYCKLKRRIMEWTECERIVYLIWESTNQNAKHQIQTTSVWKFYCAIMWNIFTYPTIVRRDYVSK